jgi:hypothetical protein
MHPFTLGGVFFVFIGICGKQKKDASTGSILFESLIERDTRASKLHPDKKKTRTLHRR